MSRFSEIRVRLLASIAIGLTIALVVHAVTRDPKGRLTSLWHYTSPGSEHGSEVLLPEGETPADPEQEEGVLALPTALPTRGGGLLIDGGDYTGPFDTPTPYVAPTMTPVSSMDPDDERERAAREAGGGFSVNVPAAASPTSSSDEDDFMVGAWTRRGGGYLPATPGSDLSGLPWVGGQPRGYAMLYALQPEARPVVEGNVAALLSARVREPYIAVLVDGTFGKDFGYLRDLIKRLNTEGRNLHLALYLANGPAQRRYKNPPYEAPFVRTSPEDFRREIRRSNSDAQIQYLNIIADARRLFEHNILTNPDARNYAVVMLEDNLDSDSFRAMSNIAREQLEAVATIVRNPCIGCYDGNDGESLGYGVEEHSPGRFDTLDAGDGFTLDGFGFLYPTESRRARAVTSEQLISLAKGAFQRDLEYFGLWRETWQGVMDGGPLPPPKTRSYTPSTADEMEFEIQALRAGLPFVNSDDTVRIDDDEDDSQFFDQMGEG